MDDLGRERPISPSRLSKTPSWITLGFVLGALFVFSLPRERPSRSSTPPVAPPPVQRLERPKISEIEAVFDEWGRYALWADDITQVALWDTQTHKFSIFYEVLRSSGNYYFRSISRIDRIVPPEEMRLPANAPLRFARMLVGDLPAPAPVREREFRPVLDTTPRRPVIPAEPSGPTKAPVPIPSEPLKTTD